MEYTDDFVCAPREIMNENYSSTHSQSSVDNWGTSLINDVCRAAQLQAQHDSGTLSEEDEARFESIRVSISAKGASGQIVVAPADVRFDGPWLCVLSDERTSPQISRAMERFHVSAIASVGLFVWSPAGLDQHEREFGAKR